MKTNQDREAVERAALAREIAFQRKEADGHVCQLVAFFANVVTTKVVGARAERLMEILASNATAIRQLQEELAALDAERGAV